MKCKKLIALALTGVMTLALAAPSFAAETKNATVISGMFEEIEIDVIVPSTGSAVINPFSMPVKIVTGKDADGKPTYGAELETAGAISTQPLVAINKSGVALDVGATVTATVKGSLLLGKAAITDSTKTKTAVVYLEAINNEDLGLTGEDKVDYDTLMPETAASGDTLVKGMSAAALVKMFNAWETTSYDFTAGAKNEGKILAGATAVTKAKICTLGKTTVTPPEGEETEPTVTVADSAIMLYRLGGDAVKNPSTAWNSKDGVTVNVAFTFSPTTGTEEGEISLDEDDGVTLKYEIDGVSATGTVKWELLDAGTTEVTVDKDGGTVTLNKAGKIKVKATATATDGTKSYATGEVTVAAKSAEDGG